MNKDSLGSRMKEYENVSQNVLTRRMPVIIRIDGKAFHSFTKGFEKPFDMILMESMWRTTKHLCESIMNCKMAYTQSDEISLLLVDYDNIQTQPWFNNNVQKMVSISASMATMAFNNIFRDVMIEYARDTENDISTHINRVGTAMFDARVYNLPKEEVANYFIWRQVDATRNAIQMVGRANFSHKQLQNKSCDEIQEMLFQEKNLNFNDIPTYQKRGVCCIKIEETFMPPPTGRLRSEVTRKRWNIDKNIPIFTQNREYITGNV